MIATVKANSVKKQKFIEITKNFRNSIRNHLMLHAEITELKRAWNRVMINCSLYNFEEDTYSLVNIEKTVYGYFAMSKIPAGLTYTQFQDNIERIECHLNCILLPKYSKMEKYIKIQIITEVPDDSLVFSPPRIKPWELYLGNGLNGNPVIKDMTSLPHILDTGVTGSGKSRLLDMVMTTLIYNNSPKDLHLYLMQIDKIDLAVYEDCDQVRYFANTMEKAYALIKYLFDVVHQRNDQILPYKKKFLINSYLDYNKMHPMNPMATSYLIIDEFSSLMPRENGDDNIKKMKKAIIFYLEEVIRLGRSVGVFVIMATQRPTADMLSPFLKSQVNNIITFKQINDMSSRVAIDIPDAVYLPMRQAIIKSNELEYMKTPFMDDGLIKKYILGHIKPYHKTLDLKMPDSNEFQQGKKQKGDSTIKSDATYDTTTQTQATSGVVDLRKLAEQIQGMTTKKEIPTFDQIKPISSADEIVKQNISKIPNFVPWQPATGSDGKKGGAK